MSVLMSVSLSRGSRKSRFKNAPERCSNDKKRI